MKMIIRNCPCYMKQPEADCWADQLSWCENYTDCILKQIVELCEKYKKDYNTTNGVWLLANNITNLLGIQGVE